MSLIQNILGKLFGTKADRDFKELKPIIKKVNHVSPTKEDFENKWEVPARESWHKRFLV